jgi:hypothetical protein
VNIWFDSLKDFFISEGFATTKTDTTENNINVLLPDELGEIEFGDGQEERVCNLDESAIILDNTSCNNGARPAMSFYDPNLQDTPRKAAFKNSCRATDMFGATMSGRAVPLHFVLPMEAQVENQGLHGAEFIEHSMKSVLFDSRFEAGVWDENAKKNVPSWGMNEKGSMTKEELENHFMNHFARLFPDKADLPGYCVAVLIDGGPGCTNLEMLAKLRLMGILLFPSGPLNTTALLQILDQPFYLFKTVFLQNFELLWEFRLNLPADDTRHERIGKNDIGLLMFGGILPDGTILRDAFDPKNTSNILVDYPSNISQKKGILKIKNPTLAAQCNQ